MYLCKHCGNFKEFIENYTDSVRVFISDEWDFCHSESDPQLLEVVCCSCKNSSEDWIIYNSTTNEKLTIL
jgi:hypothetical protein